MVQVAGVGRALDTLKASIRGTVIVGLAGALGTVLLYSSCTTRVLPNEWGVEQRRFGLTTGIVPQAFGPGLYFIGPGVTMHTFPREIHGLEASYDRDEAMRRAGSPSGKVSSYVDRRERRAGA